MEGFLAFIFKKQTEKKGKEWSGNRKPVLAFPSLLETNDIITVHINWMLKPVDFGNIDYVLTFLSAARVFVSKDYGLTR